MRNSLLITALFMAVLPPMGAFPQEGIPDGMCEVVLEAHDVFENGSNGFQLLLDSRHSTFGEIFFDPGTEFNGDYTSFDYKIPENADPVGSTSNCVVDGEVSIYVPAGIYDWMTILPLHEGLGIPHGDYAVGDDFVFEAGKTYRFKAGLRQGKFGEEDCITLEVDSDYGISSLCLPSTGMGMGSAEEISVKITNCAKTVSDNVVVYYSINGGEPVREKLSETIAPGQTIDYHFAAKADFSNPMVYNVLAGIEASGDMLPLNNTVSGVFRHFGVVELPFVYNFASNRDNFSMDWIIIDANGDDSTWGFNEWMITPSGEMGSASCSASFDGDKTGDDWLISQPLDFKSGKAHVLLDIRSVHDNRPEKLEVCIGTSTRPEDMRVLGTFTFATEDWIKKSVNFDVQSGGIYYIALHGVSEDGLNIHVADIEIGEGEFVGKPEIALVKTIAPFSNCNLPADGKVGLMIDNRGTGDFSNFTLTCEVTGPGDIKTVVSDTFDGPLSPDESAVFMIGDGVDFSNPGKYILKYRLTGDDVNLSASCSVNCLEPYSELPVLTNFSYNVNTSFWTMMDEEGWTYEAFFKDFSARKHGLEYGLLGRGMTLSNPVRVKMSYAAGGGWDSTVLSVFFGKAGEDPSTYEAVFTDDYVTNDAKELEFSIPVTEPGNYSIVIADMGDPENSTLLRLNEVVISELFPHDLRIERCDGPVARYMPVAHTGKKGQYGAVVTNRGSETMTGVRIDATINGVVVGASVEELSIPVGKSVTIPFEVELPHYGEGDMFTLSIAVSADETDDYPADNRLILPETSVTKDMLSAENISDLEYGVGSFGEQFFIGNVYTLAAPSPLTSVNLGLCYGDGGEVADQIIGLNVYMVKDGKLGRRIFSHECRRGNGGFLTIDMQDMMLPVGSYYFEAAQLSTYNLGLAYDIDNPGICWTRTGDEIMPTEGYSLAIRAFFGSDAKVYAKDASALEFVTPKLSSALYGDDETVIVNVRNAGSEDAAYDVELSVDGLPAGTKRVESLFFEDSAVEFTGVDLSRPGTHILECRVRLDGDENASNDKVTKTIVSAELLDPYSMDFEGCNDFDAAGDRLNPAWTTEDLNGIGTTYFWRYTHRNSGLPCGFMAFNTHATVPSMDESPTNGFYAYEGDRFGVAYCYDSFAEGAENFTHSDVWMVSPFLQLGDNSSFKAYVKTFALESRDSKLEPFRVLVSEEPEGYESFAVIGDDRRLAPVNEWGLAEADLSAYDNKKVRVAIQYIGEPYKNTCLMIDNLKIDTRTSGLNDIYGGNVNLRYDAANQLLMLDNGSGKLDMEVYTIDGVRMAFAAKSDMLEVGALPSGIYVARAGTSVIKFVK